MSRDLRAFFNERAPLWDSMQEVPREKLRALLSELPIPPGGKILDVGSGTGVLVPFLRELFSPSLIVELDMAEAMLAEARKKFGDDGIRYVLGDAKEATFPETFDAILCYSSFPHFEDKERTVAHLLTFLKGGGVFAIIHTTSRDHVNAIHTQNDATRDHLLPEGRDVASMLSRLGLLVFVVRDTPWEYLVAGVKESVQ